MRKFTSKRSALLAVVGVLAVSAAAIAYWTASGSGSGNGSVVAGNGAVALTSSVDSPSTIFPGGGSDITYYATNDSDTDVYVTSVSATVNALAANCADGDFSIATVNQGVVVPAHTTTPQELPTKGHLAFANSGADQDACKGTGLSFGLSSL